MGGKVRAKSVASEARKAARKLEKATLERATRPAPKREQKLEKARKKAIKTKRKALVELMEPGRSYSRLQLRALLRAGRVPVSNAELQRTIRRLLDKGDVVRHGQRAGARWTLA